MGILKFENYCTVKNVSRKRKKKKKTTKYQTIYRYISKKINKCTRMVVYYSLLWSVCFIIETWKITWIVCRKEKGKERGKGKKEKKIRQIWYIKKEGKINKKKQKVLMICVHTEFKLIVFKLSQLFKLSLLFEMCFSIKTEI